MVVVSVVVICFHGVCPGAERTSKDPTMGPFSLGLLIKGSSILRHGVGGRAGAGEAVPRRCGRGYSPHMRDRRA